MDFKKFLEMSAESNKPEITKVINESTEAAVKNYGKKSLKDYFQQVNEALTTQTPIPVVGKAGDKATSQAGFLHIDDQSPAGKAMSQALANLAKDKKAQIVVPTTQQAGTTTSQTPQAGLSTAGGATAVKEEDVMEKAPPGMEDMVLKLKKQYPGKPELAFATAWKIYNKKHGKTEGAEDNPESAMLDEKWAGGAEVKPTGQYKDKTKEELKSMLAKLHKSGPHDKDSPAAKKMRQINFALRAKGGWKKGEGAAMKEAEIPHAGPDYGAGIGAGRSATTLESQKVTESMNTLEAAYHEGKSHGLSKHGYACRYNEGSEEHRRYHEGFKEGLDECYGLQPNRGLVVGETVPATVPGMADQAEAGLDEMDKTAYMKQQAIKTPGPTFKAFGQTMHDKDVLEADAFAFESLDQKLNALLNETVETVAEGVNVSMSQGQGGMHGDKLDDSVSVSATGDDAAKLLAFIKQVGIGGLGGSEASDAEIHADAHPVSVASDYGAPKFAGHDDMKSLIAKVTGDEEDSEEGVEEAHACNECGMMETDCGCDKEMVDEVETPDQETDEMAEGDGEGDIAAYGQEAEINASMPAKGGATNEDGAEAPGSNAVGKAEQDDAEEVNEESTAEKDDKAERAGEKVKKDIEYDDKKDKLDEWANEAGKDGTEASFERDIEFMTKVIAGGLNKPKSTGQTTIPVIAHQDARTGDEDVAAWKKLAGLGK